MTELMDVSSECKSKPRSVVIVLPSTRVSGGIIEAIKVAEDLQQRGTKVQILALWKHPNSVQLSSVPVHFLSQFSPRQKRAVFDIPRMMFRFSRYVKTSRREKSDELTIILTHYSTLLFGWLVPGLRRFCYVQDEEWLFLPEGIRRYLLRIFILQSCKRMKAIPANEFLAQRMRLAGLESTIELSIWADKFYFSESEDGIRSVDIAMVLRNGRHKRLDLYLALIERLKQEDSIVCAAITSEPKIAAEVSGRVDICLLRPGMEEMKSLYRKSKLFVLLSEQEGFGLPPLEAMGAGCVPICRDSGGPSCYMKGELAANIIPLNRPWEAILRTSLDLLADPVRLHRLSIEAQRIFQSGEKAVTETREKALAELMR